ncbi:MAG: pitrilysin family protein [Candidatus Zixiibacteriota bacterium]
MKTRHLIALAVVTCVTVMAMQPAVAQQLPPIKYEKYELPNGLDVILYEDHSIPMVAVNVWYYVGSKNEEKGRTGFAHLFEHMMFQGSQNHDAEYFDPLEKVGGSVNGSTTEDRTNYWENVPSNYLELALWLESDRMGYLLPAMTQEKLDNQRDVVKNERRQGVDNQPYGKSYELMKPLLYPADHPYSWTVIGSMEDLSAASMEDVQNFFKQYYHPANASLCIAGDFDPAEAKRLVEQYFGPIPAGPMVDRKTDWIPSMDGERRAVAEDNVQLPRLYMAWHTPGYYKPGDAEFDLFAHVLTSGKTSRLYKELVYDKKMAQDVAAYQSSGELSSTFNIQVTAREGYTLDQIEQEVDRILAEVLKTGITQDELVRARTNWETGFVRRLQRIGGFGGMADKLNEYNTMLGEPDMFQWDMDRYTNATVESVNNYARKYIDLDKRAVLHIVPRGNLMATESDVDRTTKPSGGPEPSFTPPAIQRAELSNGLELLVVEDHSLPLVQTTLELKSGWAADPVDRPGVASITADMLNEGTKNRTSLEISEEAQRIGANLGTNSTFDGTTVDLNILKKNLDRGLELMADVVLNPTFPQDELDRLRENYLGRIQQESKQPFTSAFKSFLRKLYGPEHPYGQPYTGTGTEKSLNAITRDDLVTFYENNFYPNNAAIVMVGDITLDEAKQKLEKAFKGWAPGTVVASEVPEPQPLSGTKICIVDKPGAAQSVIVAGHLGLKRNNPDWLAVEVMNNVFGGQFTSRLNMNLREDKGYTYGARAFFSARKGVGPFIAYAQVQSDVTKESVTEIINELRDITSTRPLTDQEVADSKNNMIKSFPGNFETFNGIANELVQMVRFDLPADEWQTYVDRVNAIDGAAASAAAKKYFHPDELLIVVVGDREKIEAGLAELQIGEIVHIDTGEL